MQTGCDRSVSSGNKDQATAREGQVRRDEGEWRGGPVRGKARGEGVLQRSLWGICMGGGEGKGEGRWSEEQDLGWEQHPC